MKEIWKDIPNYEGLYQASNLGRIRTCKGKITHSKLHGDRVWKERILKPKACKDYRICGYRVSLWKDGKPKDFLVARLVCTTWHENLISTKMTVNHKDGNRLNNKIENLEWLTLGDNIRDGFKNGLYKQDKVILVDAETKENFVFRSKSCADAFLGWSKGYVSNTINKRHPDFLTSKSGKKYEYKIVKNARG